MDAKAPRRTTARHHRQGKRGNVSSSGPIRAGSSAWSAAASQAREPLSHHVFRADVERAGSQAEDRPSPRSVQGPVKHGAANCLRKVRSARTESAPVGRRPRASHPERAPRLTNRLPNRSEAQETFSGLFRHEATGVSEGPGRSASPLSPGTPEKVSACYHPADGKAEGQAPADVPRSLARAPVPR